MNTRRLVVLLLAAGAAGVVALMVRGLFGGGTKEADAKVAPAPAAITQVLVAATRLEPGQPITEAQVRWEPWPAKSTSSDLILKNSGVTPSAAVAGSVVRAPIVEGEPITYTKIVRSDGAAGFMAATLAPGMRAVSISVSVVSVAGGFILPNNRVDLLLTMISDGSPKRGVTRTVLTDVRVLAIDQAFDNKNQKAVSDVKTVTLELTPEQARATTLAQAMGTLSLALRGLGDTQTAENAAPKGAPADGGDSSGIVSVIRYGMERKGGGGVQ
jgi:pilus assembly protein CpaB